MAEESKPQKKRKNSHFKKVSTEKKESFFQERKSDSTNSATKLWMNCFEEYLAENNLPKSDQVDTNDLPNILENFYTELRKVDGEEEYKLSTLKSIRAALNRNFKEKRCLDILKDERFIRSNEMFSAVAKKAKVEGRGETESKPVIEPEDLESLNIYFKQGLDGPPDAKKLQEIVLFHIIYQMGRRGHQNLRPMTKQTFKVAQDPDGRKYIYQAIKEFDKNHNETYTEPSHNARIYEIPDSPVCPVYCFENYISKLCKKRNDLWQKPKKNLTGFEEEWYFNAPLGRDPLNDTMKNLSSKANLSKIYTNHSIRATTVTTLDEHSVGDRIIMATTNHRSEASLKSYSCCVSAAKRREVSDILAKEMGNEVPQKVQKVVDKSATTSVPTNDPGRVNVLNPPVLKMDVAVPQESPPQLNEMQWEEADPIAVSDEKLVEMLEAIEKENQHVFENPQEAPSVPIPNAVLNVSNVSNIQNNKQQVPMMYFNNSSVVINYNFTK